MKQWKVLEWGAVQDGSLPLACPNCGKDAELPTSGSAGALIVAAIGLSLILEPSDHVPPASFMPGKIRCPHCQATYESGAADVR